MANHEILLAEDDIRLQSALTVTRRMRRAALSVEAEGLSAKATGTKQQSILRDAEQLVIAAAAVAIRSKRDLDTDVIPEADVLNQQRGRMDVLLGRAKKKYEGHTPYVFAGGTRNFKGELEELDRGWQDVLRLSYIGGNKIGLSVAELASSRTGVLAPLSSDYMLAEIHRAYIESKGVSTFSVKPVIVDRFDRTGDRVI
ncbi:MAG TPA: hypothetical protein VLF20_05045, partial [Patescibacteria group bacterium]|nr:hypothetical protein [Patescibacteria group bacterium]